jgi:hypothetical protein
MICEYCNDKGAQSEALTMAIEPCLYCGGCGIIHCCEGECAQPPLGSLLDAATASQPKIMVAANDRKHA